MPHHAGKKKKKKQKGEIAYFVYAALPLGRILNFKHGIRIHKRFPRQTCSQTSALLICCLATEKEEEEEKDDDGGCGGGDCGLDGGKAAGVNGNKSLICPDNLEPLTLSFPWMCTPQSVHSLSC